MLTKKEILKLVSDQPGPQPAPGGEITPEDILNVVEGSDSVSVDLNEEGDKVQIAVDNEYQPKLYAQYGTIGGISNREFCFITQKPTPLDTSAETLWDFLHWNHWIKGLYMKWDNDGFTQWEPCYRVFYPDKKPGEEEDTLVPMYTGDGAEVYITPDFEINITFIEELE